MSTTASSSPQAALSLPKGGGALKGIGETFQANLFSGTANFSVPIALSPARGGSGPQLSLGYSSGNGNGVFGLGWQLTMPRITRKTEKGLPRYDDDDVFVLTGAEDLVRFATRVVDPDSGRVTWVPEEPALRADHSVFRYRPRTEGLFARIERWVNTATGETHWRTITKDNVTSMFGDTAATRLADPNDDQRVYEWLLHETHDASGNHTLCEYAADDPSLYDDDSDRRVAGDLRAASSAHQPLPAPRLLRQPPGAAGRLPAAHHHVRRWHARRAPPWGTPLCVRGRVRLRRLARADGSASSRTARRPARALRYRPADVGDESAGATARRPLLALTRRVRDPNPPSLPSRVDVPSLRRAGRADVGPLHRLHVRHRRGHRDLAARRGDGHRLRPRRRWRGTDRRACPRSSVPTRASSPISSATNRSPPWAATSRRWP